MPSLPQLQRMTAVLSHRGPDADGFYLQGPVGLGHRRLSIIDLASGQQPMASDDKTKAIVFNGEIYNWLRGELKPLFEERVLSKNAFVGCLCDTTAIRQWWTQHQRGIRDYSPHLWALLVLDCWGRRFMA